MVGLGLDYCKVLNLDQLPERPVYMCVCLSMRQCGNWWSQGPAPGRTKFLSPNTGGIHSIHVCVHVPVCLCGSEY